MDGRLRLCTRSSPAHLVGSNTTEPIVYASVQPVPKEAREQISLDSLRDLLLPVTPAAAHSSHLWDQLQ